MTRSAKIDRLKREVPIRELVEASGVKLVRRGSDWHGRCPFHNDRTPSLVVSPKKNLWHCLGACQTGGSVIDWVMKSEGVSFLAAVKKLELGAGRGAKRPSASEIEDEAAPIERDATDRALLRQIADHYHARLVEAPRALEYLEFRGISSPAAVERFRLGFGAKGLLDVVAAPKRKSVASGEEMRRRLYRLGLISAGGLDLFAGRIVIPVLGEDDEVLDLYGRSIQKGTPAKTPKHRYLRGRHEGVFNVEALKASEEVILCEALIDALTFWCAGYTNVTTSYGVEGFTPELFEAMRRHGTKRVLLAYDKDEAGDRAADALAKRLEAELGIAPYRVDFPKGSDANAYAKLLQPASQSLGLVLEKARYIGSGPEPSERPRTARPSLTPPPITESISPPVELTTHPEANSSAAAEPDLEVEAIEASASEPSSLVEASPPIAEPSVAPIADASREAEPPEPAVSASPPLAVTQPAREPSPLEVKEDEVLFRSGDRRYRVRGLFKNTTVEVMKVNLLASGPDGFHVDTLDLYGARARAAFIQTAAKEMRVDESKVKGEIGRLLLALEGLHDERIKALLEPKPKAKVLSQEEEAAALELLRDPKLVDRILGDFERCGVVGEEVNKLTAYVAAVSRKLDDPLAIVIQSSSAAGKSSLMEAVLAFVPEEDRIKYSAMTGQSLFYMGETCLKHKILAIVEEEGAERASYALKLLQSEKELMIASTGKDPTTGKLVTQEYKVEGPVMIFLTTTAITIDEELLNRCILLTVDEDRAQTRAIHKLQRRRETLEGALEHYDRRKLLEVHQNAQRLLRPLRVANPHAERLSFGDHKTRMRRDHMKYLVLIRSIALLHQHQRELKRIHRNGEILDFIEVELSDIALANRIAGEVLSRSLDELAPQTRTFLLALDRMVAAMEKEQELERSEVRFTRRDIMVRAGYTYEQIRIHLDRLVDLEHVLVHSGRRGLSYAYELVYDGRGFAGAALIELADATTLAGAHPDFGVDRDEFGVPLGSHWSGNGYSSGAAETPRNGSEHRLLRLADELLKQSGKAAGAAKAANGSAHPRGER